MKKEASVGEYTYYSGLISVSPAQINSTTFDISAVLDGKKTESLFHRIAQFGPPSSGVNGTDGGNGKGNHTSTTHSSTRLTISTTTSSLAGTGASSWTDWSLTPSSTVTGPKYPTDVPRKPHRPCGPDQGCDAADWASETIWIVPTQGPMEHTKPAGTCTEKPTLGAGGVPVGNGQGEHDAGDHGTTRTAYPQAPVATAATSIAVVQTSVVGNKPIAPTKPVAEFTGDAGRDATGIMGILAAVGVAVLL